MSSIRCGYCGNPSVPYPSRGLCRTCYDRERGRKRRSSSLTGPPLLIKGLANSYKSAHMFLKRTARLPKSECSNTNCTTPDSVLEYALKKGATNIKMDSDGKNKGIPYSYTPLGNYIVLCAKCHRRYDKK